MTDETAEPLPLRIPIADLEGRYPDIAWREPTLVNDHYFGCRVCIANFGLKGSDVEDLPQTYEEWKLHFARHLR